MSGNALIFSLKDKKDTDSDPFITYGKGWSADEGAHRWTNSSTSEVEILNINKNNSKVKISFKLTTLKESTIKILFNQKELKEIDTVEEMKKVVPNLQEYYLPCKRNKYLSDLTHKKAVTILRQFIKCYDYVLYSKEKYIQGEKYLTYQLMSADKKTFLKLRKQDDTLIVSFD